MTKEGGARVVHYSSSLIHGKRGPVAVRGIARDITEEFKARNVLIQREEELRLTSQKLEKRVQERTTELENANKNLNEKSKNLEEANIALRVLLNKKDEDQKEAEEKMVASIQALILPLITTLKNSRLSPAQQSYLNLMAEKKQLLCRRVSQHDMSL